jgi:hypothetical protein
MVAHALSGVGTPPKQDFAYNLTGLVGCAIESLS